VTGALGTVVARALAIRLPGRDSVVGKLAARVILDSTPPSQANGMDFVSGLADWDWRRAAVLDLSLGSYDARRQWRPGGPRAAIRRCEFILEHAEPEAVTAGVKGDSVKNNLRKAERAGVDVRRAGVADLSLFAELYEETLRTSKGVRASLRRSWRVSASGRPWSLCSKAAFGGCTWQIGAMAGPRWAGLRRLGWRRIRRRQRGSAVGEGHRQQLAGAGRGDERPRRRRIRAEAWAARPPRQRSGFTRPWAPLRSNCASERACRSASAGNLTVRPRRAAVVQRLRGFARR
jgi:hypothetical protein